MNDTDASLDDILIVEDEPKIARLVADYLEGSGYATHHIDHGDQVVGYLSEAESRPSLVLLDLMLPGTDGLTLCREIRQRWPDIAVVMLTARVEEVDRLLGLELGADDYICKPFSPREVVARVKAVLRRSQAHQQDSEANHDLVLDESGWRALADGQDLGLTAVEFQLLKVMMHSPGRIFAREQLMDHMYRDHRIVSERTVDSHIKKLRKKIADIWPEREIIRSVYGVGYKYQPEE
ncbi:MULTISPECIES: response regulator [Halomonas]|jgi:two-component system response regulator BaeR|uniref:Response regulator n=3 Tax=Halomonas TaxID=2745 RepID=A0AAU7KG54_9GAMM|nr:MULTISPECIES: response regulator [Halomonas]MBR9770375.1 response regulator [Gammaproteobacteria bacterium]KJZ08066.1 transcriptional regulator [Halomonas sp. S2151]MAR72091.1 DNA-binding response regulator [Halomonas sp.]MAY70128.1 DNA-binding response regulator [Halomonas sp.]MBR9879576.1 response regulator [Gammaproteobacteria bacterium]|tara:strand:- start:486 stop:1193 length:708 start_codon:yes stop_codon:yes gene_type:complete